MLTSNRINVSFCRFFLIFANAVNYSVVKSIKGPFCENSEQLVAVRKKAHVMDTYVVCIHDVRASVCLSVCMQVGR